MITVLSDIDEIQQLARLFLAIFVLIGVAPFLRKRIIGYIDYLISLRRSPVQGSTEYVYHLEVSPSLDASLDGVDYMVFIQFAQAGDKGTTLKQLKSQLHMDRFLLIKVLQSLSKKSLIGTRSHGRFFRRLYLTDKGKAYARAKGIIL